ncbi:MAG: hypothetical protein LRY71_06325 [Bacillaceae bacterium]|nr:hypothetical protein [Bacillaceae bacterium]
MKSIQTKILMFFSIFFIVLVSTLSFFVFSNARTTVEQSIGDQAKIIAMNVANSIDTAKFDQILTSGDQEVYNELRS